MSPALAVWAAYTVVAAVVTKLVMVRLLRREIWCPRCGLRVNERRMVEEYGDAVCGACHYVLVGNVPDKRCISCAHRWHTECRRSPAHPRVGYPVVKPSDGCRLYRWELAGVAGQQQIEYFPS